MEMEVNSAYVQSVYKVLVTNPTDPINLDFLVEAHAKIGRLAAVAEGEAEAAEAERKYNEAVSWSAIKLENPKWTAAQVEAEVYASNYDYRRSEIEASTSARKLRGLLDSIREAINACKFLGREAGNGVRIGG